MALCGAKQVTARRRKGGSRERARGTTDRAGGRVGRRRSPPPPARPRPKTAGPGSAHRGSGRTGLPPSAAGRPGAARGRRPGSGRPFALRRDFPTTGGSTQAARAGGEWRHGGRCRPTGRGEWGNRIPKPNNQPESARPGATGRGLRFGTRPPAPPRAGVALSPWGSERRGRSRGGRAGSRGERRPQLDPLSGKTEVGARGQGCLQGGGDLRARVSGGKGGSAPRGSGLRTDPCSLRSPLRGRRSGLPDTQQPPPPAPRVDGFSARGGLFWGRCLTDPPPSPSPLFFDSPLGA